MSLYSFRPVTREHVPLLIGVAGGTGSGKTYSAMLLGRGLAAGAPFAFIDTENGRGKHYADMFPEMRYDQISAPFRPEKYADAIEAGAKDHPVVVVDSMSHEWAGDGGCLDWHDEIQKGDPKKNLMAWIEPKKAHKRMVTRLLQVDAHVVLCFRAEPKVEVGPGNTIIPKPSLTGLDGWIPIAEKMLPYELTASFLLMADRPGVPRPIKLQEQHKAFVPLDQPLSEDVGRRLAEWAQGSALGDAIPTGGSASAGTRADSGSAGKVEPTTAPVPAGAAPTDGHSDPGRPPAERILELTTRLLSAGIEAGKGSETQAWLEKNAGAQTEDAHLVWLEDECRKLDERMATA